MEYITTKEASAKWGISTTRITVLANEGRIPGAQRVGRSWLIPATATKPTELKANHSISHKNGAKNNSVFSFPLYHFRPDWSHIDSAQLTEQQKLLLSAEEAVLECRFADAYQILKPILSNPDDIITEIGCLWNAGICCIAMNMVDEFAKYYLHLQMLLTKNYPHRDDLALIFYALSTYVDTMNNIIQNDIFHPDIDEQCLPLLHTIVGYTHLSHEVITPGSTDTVTLELCLRYLQSTSAVASVEMMHCYLIGIYNLRLNNEAAERHAKSLIQTAYESKMYFPLVTYYHYFAPVLAPVMAQYPEDFQNHIYALSEEYEKNLTEFLTAIGYSVVSKITSEDQAYIYAVLMDSSNNDIAEKLGTSARTVRRRLDAICRKLGVSNKKELKEFLHKYL